MKLGLLYTNNRTNIDLDYLAYYEPPVYKPMITLENFLYCQINNRPIVVLKKKLEEKMFYTDFDKSQIKFIINPCNIVITWTIIPEGEDEQ